MPQSSFGHIQFNVRPENVGYYRDLMTFLGWQTLYDSPEMAGMGGKNGESLWFSGQVKDFANDYDGPGFNHLGLHVPSVADVDATVEYMDSHAMTPLFETPRHRPEFAGGEDQTYYQVMFETPDRILIEVVYIGAK